MLLDKGFYDYDYSEPKKKLTEAEIEKRNEHWSDDKVADILSKAIDPKTKKRINESDVDKLQSAVMRDISESKNI